VSGVESVEVSGGAIVIACALVAGVMWAAWGVTMWLVRRWDAAAAADPCGHNRHEWLKWSTAAPWTGYVSPLVQYRTCPRCGRTEE